MSELCFSVNVPEVMSETIEGEVIAINLASGNYYSIRGTGAAIWELLNETGAVSASEVVESLVHRFVGSRAEIEIAVARFLGELRDEGLIAGLESTNGRRLMPVITNHTPRPMFEPPRLEIFTDMRDLVLLDPVHQVDEMGWPERPDQAAGGRGR